MTSVLPSPETNRFNPRASTMWNARGYGVRYPSPFFDVAQQFLPADIQQLLHWCRYYFLTNPIINVACQKMAEYPVTPTVWESDDANLLALWRGVEDRLKFRQLRVEVGLDYHVYGNAFISVWFPIDKSLVCSQCGVWHRASVMRSHYKWRDGKFHLTCRSCKHVGIAHQVDVSHKDIRGARVIRWNPENIEIKHNEVTGRSVYYYKLPRHILNDIRMGDPDTIETLPFQFLEAARLGRSLVFSSDNFFHMKRPTIAQKDQGWGSPLIYPLLKDAFYMQVMKKAQETILLEHVVPLRVVFPGAPQGGADVPFASYNLQNWKEKVESELQIWKRDNNYIPILPVNVGYQQLGGQARALILHQEFRIHAETMLAGAGIPVEFVFGGLNWTASNTSLRALENTFLGFNMESYNLIKFVVEKVANHMGYPQIPFRFQKFKMADDLQKAMFMFQLNQANKISDQRLLEEIGEDYVRENERMAGELKRTIDTQRKMQLASADVQGAAQVKSSRYAAKAQELTMISQAETQQQIAESMPGAMQPPGAEGQPPAGGDAAQQVPGLPEGATAYDENAGSPNSTAMPTSMGSLSSPLQQGQDGGFDLRYIAQRANAFLKSVEETQGRQAANQEMEKIMLSNPQLYQLVIQLRTAQGSQDNPANPGTALSTKPFQRAPGRAVAG